MNLAKAAIFCPTLVLSSQAASVCYVPLSGTQGFEGWAFEFGVATITDSSIEDFGYVSVKRASGPAGGEVYSLGASRRLGHLDLRLWGCSFSPELEVPFTLEIVDENGRDPFANFNLSFAVRWVDFPWNETVKTEFSMGLGLSYSEKIYQIDIDRHPGEDRSNLKFNWPIQLSFALPDHEQHQLTLFIAHHSGGHVFDVGGFNSLGMGYRHEF